jgi:hypothetical protein
MHGREFPTNFLVEGEFIKAKRTVHGRAFVKLASTKQESMHGREVSREGLAE